MLSAKRHRGQDPSMESQGNLQVTIDIFYLKRSISRNRELYIPTNGLGRQVVPYA